MEVRQPTMKAGQGCWTCKRRKIGCDRQQPRCRNCLRTGRECLGYSIRLVWPDRPDGRRRKPQTVSPNETDLLPAWLAPAPDFYGTQFLNVTLEDLAASLPNRSPNQPLLLMPLIVPRPARESPLPEEPRLNDEQLLAYYETVLTPMISTIDHRNGFRTELLPMVLYSSSSASTSLRNGMLALASFHRYGIEAALPYKAAALQQLHHSLMTESSDDPGLLDVQLAACMMLCVYSVFDETEGNWHLHINGARNMLYQLARSHGSRLRYNFLYTWFLYHEVLGEFTQPLRHEDSSSAIMDMIHDDEFDTSIIIGSIGCSIEVLHIMSTVNRVRAAQRRRTAYPDDVPAYLEDRLVHLTQYLDPQDLVEQVIPEQSRILATAELYRLASLLYLLRVCPVSAPASPSSRKSKSPSPATEQGNASSASETATVTAGMTTEERLAVYTEQAFGVLAKLKVCTSPWPLFVLACEAGDSDSRRIEVLRALDAMDEARKVGNIFVLRGIIESYWKLHDLQAESSGTGAAAAKKPLRSPLKWWEMVNYETAVPWFI